MRGWARGKRAGRGGVLERFEGLGDGRDIFGDVVGVGKL